MRDLLDEGGSHVTDQCELLHSYDFREINGLPTRVACVDTAHGQRITETCIDLNYCNVSAETTIAFCVLATIFSHHLTTLIRLKSKPSAANECPQIKLNYHQIIAELSSFMWDDLYGLHDVNEAFELFRIRIMSAVKRNSTEIKSTKSGNAIQRNWVAPELYALIKEKEQAYAIHRADPTYNGKCKTYRLVRNRVTRLSRKCRMEAYCNVVTDGINNPWEAIQPVLGGVQDKNAPIFL